VCNFCGSRRAFLQHLTEITRALVQAAATLTSLTVALTSALSAAVSVAISSVVSNAAMAIAAMGAKLSISAATAGVGLQVCPPQASSRQSCWLRLDNGTLGISAAATPSLLC
jgi:hypothetical protein